MIGMSLTIDKAATVNSFSTVYNLSVSDMKNRYAPKALIKKLSIFGGQIRMICTQKLDSK